MADYQIGPFEFISLEGPPEYPFSQVELEARAGVSGQSLWDLGLQGVPFEVQSLVQAPSAAHAAALVRSYRQLIASELVLMRWGGFDVTGVSFAVLAVRPLRVAGVLMGKGGTVSGVSYGVCRCAWTLVPWV